MKVMTIAGVSLRRLFRDRTNIFFVLLMPMLLILVLGAAFGGPSDPRVGVVVLDEGDLGAELADRVADVDGIAVSTWEDRESLVLAVERERLDAGVVVPADFTDAAQSGREARVEFVASPDTAAEGLRNTVEAAVEEQGSVLRAAMFAAEQTGEPLETTLARARELQGEVTGVAVKQRAVGEPFALDRLGRFDLGAYSQLLLFIFITSTTGSTALIQSRQLGVSRRMLSTPTAVRTIVAGELAGRYAVALLQGVIIMGGTWLIFDVNWGDPAGALAIFLLFALVGAGVGTLMGATFKNDQQAGAIGVVLGIGMGALGGAMIPLTIMKLFAPVMYQVAHITPHAWGIEAFEQLVLFDRGIADIVPQLAVLAGYAVVLIALGVWRLRVSLTK